MIRNFYKYIFGNVAGMVGVSIYILADTFFISVAAGADGITILNMALPLYGLIFALGSMIGIGSATRYTLEKAMNPAKSGDYFTHAILWQILLGLPFTFLGLISPGLWLSLMGGDPMIVSKGIPYIRIVLIGTPLFMINYSFTAFARNDEAPGTAMTAALFASAFNICFDYIFMFPLKMGIAGAALATTMAPVVSTLICCTHFFGKKTTVTLQKTRLSLKKLILCCNLGISAFVGEMSSAVITTVFNLILLRLSGNIGVAAYGIIANLSLVAMAILNGISQGMQPLISDHYAKGQTQQIRVLMTHALFVTLITEGLILFLSWSFTAPLVAIFNSEGNQTLSLYAFTALRLYSFGFVFAGINIILTTYFSSIGNAFKASVASLLRGIFAILICAVILSLLLGMNGVWLSFFAAELITFFVILLLLFLPGRAHS